MLNKDKKYTSKLTVIIPTLNEESSIEMVLQEIEKALPSINVLVVDDGSVDETKSKVQGYQGNLNITFIDRTSESIHGLTISVLHAIKQCFTEYFVVIDGDLQHPPNILPSFYYSLEGNYDLVVGRRVKVIDYWPVHRKILSYVASFSANLSLLLRKKNRVKDVMSGYFGSKTILWKELLISHEYKFTLKGYKILYDFLKIYSSNLRIQYIDYTFGSRNYGSSKINRKVIWEFFKSLF